MMSGMRSNGGAYARVFIEQMLAITVPEICEWNSIIFVVCVW